MARRWRRFAMAAIQQRLCPSKERQTLLSHDVKGYRPTLSIRTKASERNGHGENLVSDEVTEPPRRADVDLDAEFNFKGSDQGQNVEGMVVFVKVNEKVHVTLKGVVASHHTAEHSHVIRVVLGRKRQESVAVCFDQLAQRRRR